ncbi:MAG: Hdr-like menaquinol oxidoreductase cytochrome c subunit [Gammaproteobacteria bacterium]|nr:Hdr-like menaquinol oxidoreductase cytochrome c subunit [Gammaproteobacteria bacterium]
MFSLRALTLTMVLAGLATTAAGDVPRPEVKAYKGETCVEETGFMRRNHMELILHQRDETMHRGIRTTKHSLKECIECHADPQTRSVLGENGFCQSCHSYAAVSIDCFSCHTPKAREQSAAVEKRP